MIFLHRFRSYVITLELKKQCKFLSPSIVTIKFCMIIGYCWQLLEPIEPIITWAQAPPDAEFVIVLVEIVASKLLAFPSINEPIMISATLPWSVAIFTTSSVVTITLTSPLRAGAARVNWLKLMQDKANTKENGVEWFVEQKQLAGEW